MSKENIVILFDNSEFMRNGDYTPSRFEAQRVSGNMIIRSKTGSNRETKIGLMSMAGKSPVVVTSLTTKQQRLLASSGNMKINGYMKFSLSVKIAQLAVKRGGDRGGDKRLIIFVGSPIEESIKDMKALGKRLKRNNICLDVINFGEYFYNQEKLDAFVTAAQKKDNCNLLTVTTGPHILSDMILTSPILESRGPEIHPSQQIPPERNIQPNTQFAATGGVDPNVDPELAEALRLSKLEFEAQQKQEVEDKAKETTQQEQKTEEGDEDDEDEDDGIDMDEDEEMQRAIELSMRVKDGEDGEDDGEDEEEGEVEYETDEEGEEGEFEDEGEDGEDETDDDDDELLRQAMAMSQIKRVYEANMADIREENIDPDDEELKRAKKMSVKPTKVDNEDISDIISDDAFLDKVVSNLPGMKEMKKKEEEKKKKKEGKK